MSSTKLYQIGSSLSEATSLIRHCIPCGSECCRYSSPIVHKDERDRIVEATGKAPFTEVRASGGSYFVIGRTLDGAKREIAADVGEEGEPCSFLGEDGLCSIQDIKPLDCRAYPVRAVPQEDGGLTWHLHRSCPASGDLDREFIEKAVECAKVSAARFQPTVFRDWLERFSQWTLSPKSFLPAPPTSSRKRVKNEEDEMEAGTHDAEEFMEMAVRELAATQPELRDGSGRAFWPTPAMFPNLLAECLEGLQDEITRLYLDSEWDKADLLANCRCDLLKIVGEGDLGENHTALFLKDHPTIKELTTEESRNLPFYRFCSEMLDIENPVVLLGALMRNEEGSLGEMEALLDEELITRGPFAELHIVEEEEHARLAENISARLRGEPAFGEDYQHGYALHDEIYTRALA